MFAREIELDNEASKERLDRYLASHLQDCSRSAVQKAIERGQVSLNGTPCTEKKTLVKAGDRLVVTFADPEPLDLLPEDIPLEILFEDAHLLVVNKPAGLVVHPAPGHDRGTLVNALLARCPDLAGIGGVRRPGIVHRLDKDTTGAMVVAKTDFAHQHLQAQLKAKTARREYLGVVCGAPATTEGTIAAPIGRHPADRKKMAVVSPEKGKAAVTHWQIVERLGNYTLVCFRLETGRTHQIRVHSSAIGHPLVGDRLYGRGGKTVGVNLPGQALHAWKLRLDHPLSGEPVEAIAPPPKVFETLLAILRRR